MTDIVSFPHGRTRLKARDLNGQKPVGHPDIRRGPRGRIILEVGQVWVEGHNNVLWILDSMEKTRDTFYPHTVTLRLYGIDSNERRVLAEATFRSVMKVWEDHVEFAKSLVKRLSEDPDAKEFFGSSAAALSFFGLDPKTGNRTD